MASRRYENQTLKKLLSTTLNRCCAPNCEEIIYDGKHITGDIAHIKGLNPGSARYDSDMSVKDRNSEENLIYLCRNHHEAIDKKAEQYPVDLLRDWKKRRFQEAITKKFDSNPSLLHEVIKVIANTDFDLAENENSNTNSFKIIDKIEFNDIKEYKYIILEYRVYESKLSEVFRAIEEGGSRAKERLMRNIQSLYLKEKNKEKQTADEIIESISEKLREETKKLAHYNEDVNFAIDLLIVDAFMNCKILEKPPKQ